MGMTVASHVEEAAVAKEKAAESAVSEKAAMMSGDSKRAEKAALAEKEANAEAALADAEVAEESGDAAHPNINITRARLALDAADAQEAAEMSSDAAATAAAKLNGLSSAADKKKVMLARMQSARANVT